MAHFIGKVRARVYRQVKDTVTFIWKIEYVPENKIRFVESQPISFYIEPTISWNLSLRMNGDETALYLNRLDDNGPDEYIINFELSLVILGRLTRHIRVCKNHTFLKKDHYCYYDFLRLDNGQVPLWLPSNNLTVRCRMWKDKKEIEPTISYFSTVFVRDRTSMDWCIKDFAKSQKIPRTHIEMTTPILGFVASSLYFIMDFETNCPTYVRIVLRSIDMRKVGRLSCNISILTTSEKLVNSVTQDCPSDLWNTNKFVWDFPYTVHRSVITTDAETYLPDDVLTLRFNFEFWVPLSDGTDYTVFEASDNKVVFPIPTGESSPSDDSIIYPRFEDFSLGGEDTEDGNSNISGQDSAVGCTNLEQRDNLRSLRKRRTF